MFENDSSQNEAESVTRVSRRFQHPANDLFMRFGRLDVYDSASRKSSIVSDSLPWSLGAQIVSDCITPPNSEGLRERKMSKSELDKRLEILRLAGQSRHTFSRIEDKICEMFCVYDAEFAPEVRVNVTKFLEAIAATGLRHTDPRLSEMRKAVSSVQATYARNARFWTSDGLCVESDVFKGIIMDNIDIVNRALTGQFVLPCFSEFCDQLEELYNHCVSLSSGKVASYIPQLARCDPKYWGVAVCTVDGQRMAIGDVTVPFTLQSTSKPFSYCIACAENGCEYVHKFVGQEPSGRSFNELVLDNNMKPHNPMINAGSIMTTSLIKPFMRISDRFDHVFEIYKKLCGGEYLGFNNAVFLSERQAADRNYALAYFMREHGCFPNDGNIDEILDFYFMMCSIEATCESASVMAATLANGGVCPITGQVVLDRAAIRNTLSLMHSCGMYDYSGQFAFQCGVPAKSGVSGIILLVIPNVMGLAIYSPPLDVCGNSVKGVTFCKELIERYNFHHFDSMNVSGSKQDPRKSISESRADSVHKVLFAAAAGDVTALRRYSLLGVDMSAADYDGRTALHLAASEGHLKIVDFLLTKCRVPVNFRDRWKRTALDEANENNHTHIATFIKQYCIKASISCSQRVSDVEDQHTASLNDLSTRPSSQSHEHDVDLSAAISTVGAPDGLDINELQQMTESLMTRNLSRMLERQTQCQQQQPNQATTRHPSKHSANTGNLLPNSDSLVEKGTQKLTNMLKTFQNVGNILTHQDSVENNLNDLSTDN